MIFNIIVLTDNIGCVFYYWNPYVIEIDYGFWLWPIVLLMTIVTVDIVVWMTIPALLMAAKAAARRTGQIPAYWPSSIGRPMIPALTLTIIRWDYYVLFIYLLFDTF